jgi:hypothetical protein
MKSIEEQSFPELISQLTFSPLYIFMVIICIGYLYYWFSEPGCMNILLKFASITYILIYLLSIYFRIIL